MMQQRFKFIQYIYYSIYYLNLHKLYVFKILYFEQNVFIFCMCLSSSFFLFSCNTIYGMNQAIFEINRFLPQNIVSYDLLQLN